MTYVAADDRPKVRGRTQGIRVEQGQRQLELVQASFKLVFLSYFLGAILGKTWSGSCEDGMTYPKTHFFLHKDMLDFVTLAEEGFDDGESDVLCLSKPDEQVAIVIP